MRSKDFSVTLFVEQKPKQVFNAVLNVREWWQGFYNEVIIGDTSILNGVFSFRAGNGAHFTQQKLIEMVPNKKLVGKLQIASSLSSRIQTNGKALDSFLKSCHTMIKQEFILFIVVLLLK